MEIFLAIVVASAVIFFGALISLGNERQRKAIDGLREQVTLWAVQDLKIKREHLAQTVQVPDPLGWLNKTVSKVYGYDLKLQVIEVYDEPQALVCTSSDGEINFIFSPFSPNDLSRIRNSSSNRLLQLKKQNPLLSLPKTVKTHELSILSESYYFDLELGLAWENLTGQKGYYAESLWIYFFKQD